MSYFKPKSWDIWESVEHGHNLWRQQRVRDSGHVQDRPHLRVPTSAIQKRPVHGKEHQRDTTRLSSQPLLLVIGIDTPVQVVESRSFALLLRQRSESATVEPLQPMAWGCLLASQIARQLDPHDQSRIRLVRRLRVRHLRDCRTSETRLCASIRLAQREILASHEWCHRGSKTAAMLH